MEKILYIINKEESNAQQLLVIDLKIENLFNPSGTTLKQLANSREEKQIIDYLIKEELQYLKKKLGRTPAADSTSFQQIHIPSNQSIEALEMLSTTQRLYFNHKNLVVDLYTKVEFYYSVEKKTSDTIHITGHLKWKDQDITLSECDFIGQGSSPGS